jgi:hypothetical protein
MAEPEDVILEACNDPQSEYEVSELVRIVMLGSSVDESTAKAAILRLRSEGQIELTADWKIRGAQISTGGVIAA